LDDEISTLNQERQGLLDAPVSRDEYATYVKADIAKRGELFARRINGFASHKGRGSARINTSFIALERALNGSGLQNIPFMNGEDCFDGFNPTPEAFYWYFGDLIADRFMAALDAVHDWPKGGVPLVDRRNRIAELDQAIEKLVDRRDELVSQLNSVGITE
jgi:hypothetical protein